MLAAIMEMTSSLTEQESLVQTFLFERAIQRQFPEPGTIVYDRKILEHLSLLMTRPVSEIFSVLVSDKHAEREAGFPMVLIDPTQFSLSDHQPRLHWMADDFLLVARSADSATFVSHTPFLMMSSGAVAWVKETLGVSRIDLVYTLPELFTAARQAVARPESSEVRKESPGLKHSHLPYFDLEGFQGNFNTTVPATIQRRYRIAPVYLFNDQFLTLAVASEPDVFLRSEIRSHFKGFPDIAYGMAAADQIDRLIAANELNQTETFSLVNRLTGAGNDSMQGRETVSIDVSTIGERASQNDASIIPLLDAILAHAAKQGASDLHIAPFDGGLAIEYRVDDWKQAYPEQVPGKFAAPIISRLKYLSNIDIQRLVDPQYGRFTMTIKNVGDIEVRTTIMPTVYGDSVTLRFAPKGGRIRTLEENGMQPREIGVIERVLEGSSGLLMVVGPTGSGKSTTLYSVLASIETDKWEVLSAEEPPERYLPGIKQTDITRGITYPSFLAGALRADPDFINLGETRTPDTAAQLIRAVETGHICFTTLHTAQACGVPGRMFGLEIAPYSLADTLSAVIAQTLIAKVCPRCAKEVEAPSEREMRGLGIRIEWFGSNPVFKDGQGCSHCMGRGFRGRMLVAESYCVDSTIRELILRRAPSDEIRRAQEAQGGRTLLEQACGMAATGVLPLSKVIALGASGRE